MSKPINYLNLYGAFGSGLTPEEAISRRGESLGEVVDAAMNYSSGDAKHTVDLRAPRDDVCFSTDFISDSDPQILLLRIKGDLVKDHFKRSPLLKGKDTEIAALRYQTGDSEDFVPHHLRRWRKVLGRDIDLENFLGIKYLQATSGTDKDMYQKSSEVLGSRPLEFLLAQFLVRAAPVLHERPETQVVLSPGDSGRTKSTSSRTLRDRFLDKEWQLNPNKERVRQILGEDNAWLSPQAVQARKEKYDSLNEPYQHTEQSS